MLATVRAGRIDGQQFGRRLEWVNLVSESVLGPGHGFSGGMLSTEGRALQAVVWQRPPVTPHSHAALGRRDAGASVREKIKKKSGTAAAACCPRRVSFRPANPWLRRPASPEHCAAVEWAPVSAPLPSNACPTAAGSATRSRGRCTFAALSWQPTALTNHSKQISHEDPGARQQHVSAAPRRLAASQRARTLPLRQMRPCR